MASSFSVVPSSNTENNISAPVVTRKSNRFRLKQRSVVGTMVPKEYDIHTAGECNNHNTNGTEANNIRRSRTQSSTNSVSMTSSRSPSPQLLNRIRTLMLSENRTLLLRREASESRFSWRKLEWRRDGLPGEGVQYSWGMGGVGGMYGGHWGGRKPPVLLYTGSIYGVWRLTKESCEVWSGMLLPESVRIPSDETISLYTCCESTSKWWKDPDGKVPSVHSFSGWVAVTLRITLMNAEEQEEETWLKS